MERLFVKEFWVLLKNLRNEWMYLKKYRGGKIMKNRLREYYLVCRIGVYDNLRCKGKYCFFEVVYLILVF